MPLYPSLILRQWAYRFGMYVKKPLLSLYELTYRYVCYCIRKIIDIFKNSAEVYLFFQWVTTVAVTYNNKLLDVGTYLANKEIYDFLCGTESQYYLMPYYFYNML